MRTRILVALTALAAAGVTLGAATISSADTNAEAATATSVTQTTLAAPCPPPPVSCPTVSNGGPAKPVTASTYLTEAQAIGEITRFWMGTGHALLTTYADASNVMGDPGANPTVNPNTMVWLVTVTAALGRGFSEGSSLGGGTTVAPSRFFSTVIYAASGVQIDQCYGCEAVTSG